MTQKAIATMKNTEKIIDVWVMSDINKKLQDLKPKSGPASQMLRDYEDNRDSQKFSEAELKA